MIIFDLDGTLANNDHRKHLVDPSYPHPDYHRKPCEICIGDAPHSMDPQYHNVTGKKWHPDYEAFDDACDKDGPIESTIHVFQTLWSTYGETIEIWSGRSERVRCKTQAWLLEQALPARSLTKMRPIGDNTPDDQLKELWLHDAIVAEAKTIDYVFDDRPKVIRMWRRYGIFVFNCCQDDEEF